MNNRVGEKSKEFIKKLIKNNIDFPFALLTGAAHLLESWTSLLLSLWLSEEGECKVSELECLHIPAWPLDSLVIALKQPISILYGAHPLENLLQTALLPSVGEMQQLHPGLLSHQTSTVTWLFSVLITTP